MVEEMRVHGLLILIMIKRIEVVEQAISDSGYNSGKEVAIGIDFASSSFWNETNQSYDYPRQGLVRIQTNRLILLTIL